MYLYWEQTIIENYSGIKYSLYVASVGFRDFIDNFGYVGGAQVVVANLKFQEELFKLEQVGESAVVH